MNDVVQGRMSRIHVEIPSQLELIDGICDRVRTLLGSLDEVKHCFAAELLLREAMLNAILHGNRSDKRRRVMVDVSVGRAWIVLRVADEGPGFAWRVHKRAVPDESMNSGRGMAIGTLYSDRMRYNRAGNRVEFRIRRVANGARENL